MVVELLLRTDADIDFRDGELRTPLHRAVQQSHALHLDIIVMLLARGAEVKACLLLCLCVLLTRERACLGAGKAVCGGGMLGWWDGGMLLQDGAGVRLRLKTAPCHRVTQE
jgi:ankyrin repeat protein